jgi:hypothetical protein
LQHCNPANPANLATALRGRNALTCSPLITLMLADALSGLVYGCLSALIWPLCLCTLASLLSALSPLLLFCLASLLSASLRCSLLFSTLCSASLLAAVLLHQFPLLRPQHTMSNKRKADEKAGMSGESSKKGRSSAELVYMSGPVPLCEHVSACLIFVPVCLFSACLLSTRPLCSAGLCLPSLYLSGFCLPVCLLSIWTPTGALRIQPLHAAQDSITTSNPRLGRVRHTVPVLLTPLALAALLP